MDRTRAEYEDDVKHLGKFEAECPLCPYFSEVRINGMYDEDFGPTSFHRITDDDRTFWRGTDWLDRVYGVALSESDQGFASLTCYESEADYDAATHIESEHDAV